MPQNDDKNHSDNGSESRHHSTYKIFNLWVFHSRNTHFVNIFAIEQPIKRFNFTGPKKDSKSLQFPPLHALMFEIKATPRKLYRLELIFVTGSLFTLYAQLLNIFREPPPHKTDAGVINIASNNFSWHYRIIHGTLKFYDYGFTGKKLMGL